MARQHCQEDNLFDVFNHLWLFTDPVLRKYGENESPKNIQKSLSADNRIVKSQFRDISADDKIFQSLIVNDEIDV